MSTAIIIIIIAVIVVFAARSSMKHIKGDGGCCGGGSGSIQEESAKLDGPVVSKKILHIEGMHCDNCKNAVMRYLQKIEGVSANVNLKKNIAAVEMDREIPDDELVMAVEKAGYTVTSVE